MSRIPRATYRLQFHKGFTFQDAAQLCDYLASLGISHIYASSYLQAATESMHGYDVVNYGQVSRDIGGRAGHEAFCQSLNRHRLGQILDIVPNHMAIISPDNVWWYDVLENGPSSRYASYFDVDWNPDENRFKNKIVLPILGDHYGRVLESLDIQLRQDKGSFTFQYNDHIMPVSPNSMAYLVRRAATRIHSELLSFISDGLESLPLPMVTDTPSIRRRHRDKEIIRSQLAQLISGESEVAAALESVVKEINTDPEELHSLLEQQVYRLAYWRMAGHELGYRRFFDINNLAGLRIEEESVFDDVHELVLRWLKSGVLAGLRIDHLDGLWDPVQYFERLRKEVPDAWVIVEKILQPYEQLRKGWPIEGTTGYEFLNLLAGLFVDPQGEKPFNDFYKEFTGEQTGYSDLLLEKKNQVLNELLDSDVNRLTDLMVGICEHNRRYRDFTRYEVHEAVLDLAASFPVYRTYIRAHLGQIAEEDRDCIITVIDAAKSRQSNIDPQLFDFLRDVFLLKYQGDLETEFIMRFQQLTDPVAAKGIEDTAFYCYNRLVALNEVGGNPGRFGTTIDEFHLKMHEKTLQFPHAMLATSTHDTKRSEDMRARLYLLSEIPEQWVEAVRRWSAHNEKYRQNNHPDRNTEYLIYQTLVGAWPIELERIAAYMQKAVREAKKYSSWTHPDSEYENAVLQFVEKILSDQKFLVDLKEFIQPLISAGRINSLAQTLIKFTAPGVPDIYQGMELWDFSLVDPDNRRPVDFGLRRELLASLEEASPEAILQGMESGLPKMWVIRQALWLRKRCPERFESAGYQPLAVQGTKAGHVVAFIRGNSVVTVCPRLIMTLAGKWEDTSLTLPQGDWLNELTGEQLRGGNLMLHDLLNLFPVALLSRKADR